MYLVVTIVLVMMEATTDTGSVASIPKGMAYALSVGAIGMMTMAKGMVSIAHLGRSDDEYGICGVQGWC